MKEAGYCEGCDEVGLIETDPAKSERGFCSSCQAFLREQHAQLPPGCFSLEEMLANIRGLNLTVARLRIKKGNAGPADFIRHEVAS